LKLEDILHVPDCLATRAEVDFPSPCVAGVCRKLIGEPMAIDMMHEGHARRLKHRWKRKCGHRSSRWTDPKVSTTSFGGFA
jgi:hypothetical protein